MVHHKDAEEMHAPTKMWNIMCIVLDRIKSWNQKRGRGPKSAQKCGQSRDRTGDLISVSDAS